MIRHSFRRVVGGRRYSVTERAAARAAEAAGHAPTLTADAVAAMTSDSGIRTVADVLFELESNRLRRPVDARLLASGVEVAPASGELPSLTNGRRTSTTADPAVVFPATVHTNHSPAVELTWSDARTVNVVEVHGADAGRRIVAVAVHYLNDADDWVPGGSGTGIGGRVAVQLPAPVTCYGVRAYVTEVQGGLSGLVAVVEVDPMLVLDVSDDVVELELEWSREADPGTSTSPAGSFEASSVTLTLDDTDGFWNPAMNASLDVGHRIEVAVGVQYEDAGNVVEELLPAGVFYSEPYDTDSEATTVTIAGVDRLGRDASTVVSEAVTYFATVEDLVRDLARSYLDLDDDQVVIASEVAATVIPAAYPTGDLGTYLADIAKAVAGTVNIDPLDRLVLGYRADSTVEPVATITDANALIRHRRPPGFDTTTAIVQVNAAPLRGGTAGDLWAMPSGGITIPVDGSYQIVAVYSDKPAGFFGLSGIVADGAYTVTDQAFYSDRAEITIRNDEAFTLTVADLRVTGIPLVEEPISARAVDELSVARYGPRNLIVDAKLVQTQAQLERVAAELLATFRSLDDNGVRRLPEVTFDALGILHATTGDRVTLRDDSKGLSGDYTILGRKLTYSAEGGLLLNDVRARDVPSSAPLLTLDDEVAGILDDVYAVG